MPSIGFSPSETPTCDLVLAVCCSTGGTAQESGRAGRSAKVAGAQARAQVAGKLTAGVESSLLIAIVGAMVETGSGLRKKTRQRCVPVDKKLALQVVCTSEAWENG